jgi:hypothetical protein
LIIFSTVEETVLTTTGSEGRNIATADRGSGSAAAADAAKSDDKKTAGIVLTGGL